MQFELGELFCGPGGLAVGAHDANIGDPNWGIKHKWATDWDADTIKTYIHNIKGASERSVLHSDIRELSYQRLHDIGDIDGLAFGFPCNDYSLVGKQKGWNGVYGPLYTYGTKALKEFQPKWFLAENVGGLRSANEGKAFAEILRSFRNEGYKLVTNLYKFEEYGLPQARHRIIIVGIHKDFSNLDFKVPSTVPYTTIDNSAETALSNIPRWATGQELTRQAEHIKERLRYIPEGKNIWYVQDATDSGILRGDKAIPDHLRLKVKKATLSQIYRRLERSKPSYTVTGSGGGGTHMYHWKEDRALTNRERARLQTFPDKHVFYGSKESQRKQVGMAVPPKGAQIIFEAILRTFKGEDYLSQPASFQEPGEEPLF